jgi:hypothetical protein
MKRMPREVEDWNDASVSQGLLAHHQKLGEAKKDP